MPLDRSPVQATKPPPRWEPVWDAMPPYRSTGQAQDMPARYPTPQGQRYLLPCHLLHHGGLWEYVLVSVEQARRWLLAGPCQSFVSHHMLREALERILGCLTRPRRRGRCRCSTITTMP